MAKFPKVSEGEHKYEVELPGLKIARNIYDYLVCERGLRYKKYDTESYGHIFGAINPEPIVYKTYVWPQHLVRANSGHVEPLPLDATAQVEYSNARGESILLGCVHTHPAAAYLSETDKPNLQRLLDGLQADPTTPFPVYTEKQKRSWITTAEVETNSGGLVIKQRNGERAVTILFNDLDVHNKLGLEDLFQNKVLSVGIVACAPKIYYLYSLVIGRGGHTYAGAVGRLQACDLHNEVVDIGLRQVKAEVVDG